MQDEINNFLRVGLPQYRPTIIRCEPDYYGAADLIAAGLGIEKPPIPPRATWSHGARFFPPTTVEEVLPERPSFLHQVNILVATKRQCELLECHRIKASPVGCPYLYAASVPERKRIEGSLLIMPPHTLPYTSEAYHEERYAQRMADIRSEFGGLAACVSQFDIDKGLWVKAFRKYDIPVVAGARLDDANALVRMKALFESFEYMTTNSLGSHVAYAAFSGCKVSFFGPWEGLQKQAMGNDSIYKRHPLLLERLCGLFAEENMRETFPTFFCEPWRARPMRDWASDMLGAENQRPLEEFIDHFQWNMKGRLLYRCGRIKSGVLLPMRWLKDTCVKLRKNDT